MCEIGAQLPGLEGGRGQGTWTPGSEGRRKRHGLLSSREKGGWDPDAGLLREEGPGGASSVSEGGRD